MAGLPSNVSNAFQLLPNINNLSDLESLINSLPALANGTAPGGVIYSGGVGLTSANAIAQDIAAQTGVSIISK
jgi:hypothetical protein